MGITVLFGYGGDSTLSKNTGGFLLTEENEQTLVRDFPEYNFIFGNSMDHTAETYAQADVMIGHFDHEHIKKATRLKWLQATTSGTDRYQGAVDPSKVIVTNSWNVFSECMAEHTFALMIAYSRSILLYHLSQRREERQRHPIPIDLFDSTVGIVGLGGIGLATARRCKAFGMRVLATKRNAVEKPDFVDELLYGTDKLDYILKESDFVVLSMPLTPETKDLISTRELSIMKPTACLVNVARGAVVDTKALTEALEAKTIAAAYLDCTNPEPLPAGHPLWQMPNVLITPHVANMSPSSNRFRFEFYHKNLSRYLKGETLFNVVKEL